MSIVAVGSGRDDGASVNVAAPAPGLHPGLSFEDYFALEAVNHSILEPFRRTPAHAREEMLHPKDSTAALALGHAFHTFMLEEPTFYQRFAVPPKVDRRFKEGKETWAAFEAENPDRVLVSAQEMQQFRGMRESILAHPTASEFLAKSVARELTFVWDESIELSESHLKIQRCKGRADAITSFGGWSWIVDLKTTKDASERSFQRDIASYGYYRGMAWYRRGLNTIRPAQRRVAFIAVEKEPPYAVAVHELDDRALDQGEREMLRFLHQYGACVASGVWPAYEDGLSLLDLPPWAVDQLD